jgi:hypothetical protein
MRKLIYLLPLFLFACKEKKEQRTERQKLDELATQYVRLGLAIGQYDKDFVDAYYGPDTLQPKTPKATVFPKDSLLNAVDSLSGAFKQISLNTKDDTLRSRANWILSQLTAFGRRIRIFSGEYASFDDESKELFGVAAPSYPEAHYRALAAKLDSLLPGKGSINSRFQTLANRFIIPKDKLDTLFRTAIATSRKRTLEHYDLPVMEDFKLEYVTNKPWSGYNWYKGKYQSLIQVNTDLQIFIDRVIDVGSHESYPGHHVYNMLLEKNLYNDRGWVEISLYPLFSPQSLIAEGSANYGVDLAFPGNEKIAFAKDVLLPLAGLDTTGISLYFAALEIKGELNYARNEVGRGLINNTMTEADALRWLMDYGFNNEETAKKSISFIRTYRSYVINYNYGKDLVGKYIGNTTDGAQRWKKFGWLLSNPVTPSGLMPDSTK